MHMHDIKSLDSIRGIATINVVLYPFYLLSNPEGNLYSSGKTWAAGHKAVILLIAYTNNIFNHL